MVSSVTGHARIELPEEYQEAFVSGRENVQAKKVPSSLPSRPVVLVALLVVSHLGYLTYYGHDFPFSIPRPFCTYGKPGIATGGCYGSYSHLGLC